MMSSPKRVDYHRKQTREGSKSVCLSVPSSLCFCFSNYHCLYISVFLCLSAILWSFVIFDYGTFGRGNTYLVFGWLINFAYSFYVIFVNDFLANVCSDLFNTV